MDAAECGLHQEHGEEAAVSWRSRLNTLLFDLESVQGKIANTFGCMAIIAAVLVSMANTVPELHGRWGPKLDTIEWVATLIFTIEYLLRVYAAHDRLGYMRSFNGIVDLAAILPLFVFGDSTLVLRLARVIRLMKVTSYFPVLRALLDSLKGSFHMILSCMVTVGLIALMAGNVVYMIEPGTFRHAFDGAWWGLVTMSTVGYGDVVPHSLPGRILASFLILLGITVFAMITAVISSRIAHAVQHNRSCPECDKPVSRNYTFCPFCAAHLQETHSIQD